MKPIEETLEFFSSKLPFRCETSSSSILDPGAIMHVHKSIEIITIYSGYMDFEIEGTRSLLGEGTILLIDSYVPHQSSVFGNETVEMNILQFESDIFLNNNFISLKSNDSDSKTCYTIIHPNDGEIYEKLISTIKFISREMKKKNAGYILYSRAKLLELIALLIRYDIIEISEAGAENLKNSCVEIVSNIIDYMEEHLAEELTLQRISQEFNVSYSYLSRVFKKVTGQNFIPYLNHMRIIRAQNMLISSNATVTDIMCSCGFTSLCYMDRMFRRIHGCSPGEYRKRFKFRNK